MDVDQRIRKLSYPIEKMTCPIYGLSERSRPDLMGSGVLLRLADTVILLTARHVFARCGSDRYVGLDGHIVGLQGKIFKTGGRDDRLDIAVCFLDSSVERELPDTDSVLPEQLHVPGTLKRLEHLLTGYPCSKQPRFVGGTVCAQPMTLACRSLAQSEHETAGCDPYLSILVRFDKKNVGTSPRGARLQTCMA